MNNNVFMVDTSICITILKNTLHDRLIQIRALVESLGLAATTNELNRSLIHDAIWAIDSDLEQAIQLQKIIDKN